jgi:hypothetical protein
MIRLALNIELAAAAKSEFTGIGVPESTREEGFCFLIFEREERPNKNQKQNTVTLSVRSRGELKVKTE